MSSKPLHLVKLGPRLATHAYFDAGDPEIKLPMALGGPPRGSLVQDRLLLFDRKSGPSSPLFFFLDRMGSLTSTSCIDDHASAALLTSFA